MTAIPWWSVIALGAGTFALRAAGPVLLAGRSLPERVDAVLGTVALALLAAIVGLGTLVADGELAPDARLAGMAVAGVAIWRRLPFAAVVVLAAAATAIARLAL